VFHDTRNPYSKLAIIRQRAAAKELGLRLRELEVRVESDVEAAFAIVAEEHIPAVVLHGYVPVLKSRDRIVQLAAQQRTIGIYPTREFVEAGGLASYGSSVNDAARRAASFAAKILNGAKPSDLPVEQPTMIEFVINMRAAKALGLDISADLLARADDVIE